MTVIFSLLIACDPSRSITMQCEVVGEPVRLLDEPSPHQVARLGDAVLVTWSRDDFTSRARWFDLASGEPLGDTIDLGIGSRIRPDWQVVDGGLEATLLTDVLHRPAADIPPSEYFGWWRVTPDGEVTRRPVVLALPDDCDACLNVGDGVNEPGLMGKLGLVQLPDRMVGVTVALDPRCVSPGGRILGNYKRLRVYSLEPPLDRPVRWSGDECQLATPGGPYESSVPWPVALSDGSIGVFFTGYVHSLSGLGRRYAILSPDGDVLQEPTTVGINIERQTTFGIGGEQGTASRLGRRILFSDSLVRGYQCSGLRRMDESGANAEDTPFQLACRSRPDVGDFWIQLENYADHAALVWSEFRIDRSVEIGDPWEESVSVALLNSEGQLASEPVIVTPPAASALWWPPAETDGPVGVPFMSSVWAGDEDGELLVSYASEAREHRGVFVRRVRCERRID